jgi:type 1 glutamine amidotransferase
MLTWLLVCVLVTPITAADKAKTVLLLGQKRDHPPGTHEYMSGLHVLAKCLQGVPELKATIINVDGPWPEGPQRIAGADGIVQYLGEGGRWMQEDAKRQEAIKQLVARGGAVVGLHWAIGAKDAQYIPLHLQWMGGMHGGPDRKYIVGEAQVDVANPEHPILRGVEGVRLNDEFYYRLKFSKSGTVTPLLKVQIEGSPETCAWAFERPDGGRSFGFGCMHDHGNWRITACRRLIAQGVLWTLKLPIPPEGLAVQVTEDDLKIRPDDRAAPSR